MAADPQRIVPRVLVQTAPSLPASDSGWTTRWQLRFDGGSEGCGTIVGEATLSQDYGVTKDVDANFFSKTRFSPNVGNAPGNLDTLVDTIVRLLKSDSAGSVTISGKTYTPFWWGQIPQQDINPDGGSGGSTQWCAAGLASVLDQITLDRGAAIAADGTSVYQLGYLPPFNHVGGADRSAGTKTVNGATVYVLDVTTPGIGNQWSARQILDLLIALSSRPQLNGSAGPAGWTWQINDPTNCLAYNPEDIDLGGKTLFYALNALIGEQRGLTWWLTVVGQTCTINVQSTIPTAITVGTYTVPAATAIYALDISSDPFISQPTISANTSSLYDVVELRGAHPWTGITLVYDGTASGSLQKGWNAGEQASWASGVDSTIDPTVGSVENVWRRFIVSATWKGGQYDGSENGLSNQSLYTTDSSFGVGGYTGAVNFDDTQPCPPPGILKAERMLPCRQKPLDTINSTVRSDRMGPRQPPSVIMYDGTGYFEISLNSHVQVDDEPPSVFIDDQQFGTLLASTLELDNGSQRTGAKLLVTVGFREAAPLKCSYQADPSTWRGATPRIKTIDVPDCELWRVVPGTIYGLDLSGALSQQSGMLYVRDDTEKLRSFLALARAIWTEPVVNASWSREGDLDIDASRRPGVLLTTSTSGLIQTTVNSAIRRRSWRRVTYTDASGGSVDAWRTDLATERGSSQLEALL